MLADLHLASRWHICAISASTLPMQCRAWSGTCRPTCTPAQALAVMTKLSTQLVAAAPPDQLVVAATRLLASSPAGVTDLSQALAVSERQLRRRFDVAAGYGPKTMQRVLRFRRVIGELTAAPRSVDLASLAVRAGYADQAHLTRETTRLAGLPPAALARSFAAGQSPPPQDEVPAV